MLRSRFAVKARRRVRAPFKPSSVQNLEQRSSASSWAPGMAALPFAIGAAAWGMTQADAAEFGDAPAASDRNPPDRPSDSGEGSPGLRIYAGPAREGSQPADSGSTGPDTGWYAAQPASQPAWGGTFIASGAQLAGNSLGGGADSAALAFGNPPVAVASTRQLSPSVGFDPSAAIGFGVGSPARIPGPGLLHAAHDESQHHEGGEGPAPSAAPAENFPVPPDDPGDCGGGADRARACSSAASGMAPWSP
jgi:hypothetical protein